MNPGDTVNIVIRVVTNPSATGSPTVQVRTSSDLSTSTPAPITADQAVTGVSVALVSTAANAETTWTVAFTTSSTGGLDSVADSTVTLRASRRDLVPVGQLLPVADTTTNQIVSSYACTPVSGSTVACPITPYNVVHAGDTLSVLLRGRGQSPDHRAHHRLGVDHLGPLRPPRGPLPSRRPSRCRG